MDYVYLAFSPINLGLALLGVIVGTVIGSMPGLTATMAIAVLIPVTFAMDPTPALILMGALYTGAIYGGAYSAILLNTPGTPSAIATTFDGYPMSKAGKGELAITLACLASVIGGLVGALALWFLSPPLAQIALSFGPVEYFWLAIFGLTLISSLSSHNLLKGMIGASLGLFLSTIGVAAIGAEIRFTFGTQVLLGGVEIVSALIGLYCIPVIMDMVSTRVAHLQKSNDTKGFPLLEALGILAKNRFNVIRSSIIGTLAGILPGAGGSIASLISYAEAQRFSKNKDLFGKGNPEGIIATESANNATVGGGFIPTFVLGIPGTPPDAVILGALLIQGIRTGPDMFQATNPMVYTFMIGLFIATLMMLPVGLLIGRYAYKFIANIPKTALVPGIVFLTLIGAYAIRNNMFDVYVMIILGVMGWLIARAGFEASPIVLGLILGRIAEEGFVQGYVIGEATETLFATFFLRPISMVLIALIGGALLLPFLKNRILNKTPTPNIKQKEKTSIIDRKKGLIVVTAIFIFGAIGFYDTLRMTSLDSYIFPRFVALCMMGLCGIYMGHVLLAMVQQRGQGKVNVQSVARVDGTIQQWRIVPLLVCIAMGVMLIPYLGFLISTIVVYMGIMTICFFEKWTVSHWLKQAAYGLCVVGGLYLFFTQILSVPLPQGVVFA